MGRIGLGENLKNLNSLIKETDKIGIVVAHPDDEVFYFGNLLLMFGEKIQIYCLTDGNYTNSGPERLDKMDDVSQKMTGRNVIRLNFKDDPLVDLNIDNITEKLKSTDLQTCNFIFTHSPHGDYGHFNHRDCFFAVALAFPEKEIIFPADYVAPDFELNLPIERHEEKLELVMKYYLEEFRDFWKLRNLYLNEGFAICDKDEVKELFEFLVEGNKPQEKKLKKYKYFWKVLAPKYLLG